MSKVSFQIGINSVNLDIKERLTFISGDSGIGKILIINMLYDIMKNPDASNITGISPNKIVVCKNEDSVKLIINKEKCLIAIDRFDIYSQDSKDIIQREIEKENNTWLIISRRPSFKFKKNVGASLSSFTTLKTIKTNTGNLIELKRV